MIESRQQAYLEAMNIPVWVERDQSAHLKTSEQARVSGVSAPESIEEPTSATALPHEVSAGLNPLALVGAEQVASTPVPATDNTVVPSEATTKQAAPASVEPSTAPTAPTAPTTTAPAPAPASSTVNSSSPGLKLGPGAGGVMLICGKDGDSASKMANDISRALGKMPVWSWPDSDEQAILPAAAVDENLFTCVAVFGEALGRLMFGNEIPASLGSAKLVILPSMTELVGEASARRELWSVFSRSGMIVN